MHRYSSTEREATTSRTLNLSPDAIELVWVGELDPYGARWVMVRDPRHPLYMVGFYFEADGKNSGVRVEPYRVTEAGAPALAPQITARLLRLVRIAELEIHARRFARTAAAFDVHSAADVYRVGDGQGGVIQTQRFRPDDDIEAARARAEAVGGDAPKRKGGHPIQLTDLFIAQQAQRYVEALPHGRPIERVAKQESFSKTQVRNHMTAARARGLLTETPRGRAGGELTPKALQILEAGNGGDK